MSNTSATGGYLVPTEEALPGNITITQYIQKVIVGITGMTNTLVRPKWQAKPPKQPDLTVDWCSFGVINPKPDANAFVGEKNDKVIMQRHEDFQVICSFYGPNRIKLAGVLRDGFQLAQNRDALTAANIGYTSASDTLNIPELVNNSWLQHSDITIFFKRQINRTYEVLPFVSAVGTIEANTSNEETVNVPWNVEEL